MEALLEKFQFHVNHFFPNWQSSGKTYMIPPSPSTQFVGPIEPGASGYDKKSTTKPHVDGIIRGDSAEAIIHKFWSTSNRHAFVMQGFNLRNWVTAVNYVSKTYGDCSAFVQLDVIEETDIDFLVLDAHSGIVLIQCKGVSQFKNNRYNDAKSQLRKSRNFIVKLLDYLKKIETSEPREQKQALEIPIKEVVSFPFVAMEERDDPMNLGRNNIDSSETWLQRLGLVNAVNWFENPFYQNLICLLLGVYSSITSMSIGANILDLYHQIDKQTFLKRSKSSSANAHEVNPSEGMLVDQFLFLNPQQYEIWHCTNNKQFMVGYPGTGKTILVMRKALEKIQEGRSVVFLVPLGLKPKYDQFCYSIGSAEGRLSVVTFDCFLDMFDEPDTLSGKDIFVDEFQKFFEMDLNEEVDALLKSEDSPIVSYFCDRRDGMGNVLIAFTNYGFSEPVTGESNPFKLQWVMKKFVNAGFRQHVMKTVVRGTSEIVGSWRSEYVDNKPIGRATKKDLSLGHNIIGQHVSEKRYTGDSYKESIFEILQEREIDSSRTEEQKLKVWPSGICVLCDDMAQKEELISFLEAEKLAVVSIEEQCEGHEDAVVVDLVENSHSYEWPVIIFLSDGDVDKPNVLPRSRAISKLFVLYNTAHIKSESRRKLMPNASL